LFKTLIGEITIRNRRRLLIIILLLVSAVIPIQGCNYDADNNNSKLDFNIKQLIEAEERGEAEEFAQQVDAELSAEGVTIIIECESGQAEAIAEAAADVGAVQVRARSQNNWVKAVVPIAKLTTLADIPGVHLVRLPWYPVEND
jgi:hypothetical protein